MAHTASAPDRVNDFVIKLANVNGTGSASANALVMKAIFRMGIPVMGKNYFPSNIQGLPTWYEIRVTRDGYVARSGRIDLMVAMKPGDLPEGRPRGESGRVPDLRLDLAALDAAHARGHHDHRRAAREDLQREFRRRAQPHPDEERLLRGRALRAARHRARRDPPAPRRDLREEAGAGRLQHEGRAAGLRLREAAPRVPAADPRVADGRARPGTS